MFGWFRRNEGFDWHKYVRTTIKLRRDDRRRKIVEAGHAVADGAKVAGKASVQAGGRLAVGTAGVIGSAAQRVATLLSAGFASATTLTARGLGPLGEILSQPTARLVSAIVALVAVVWLLAPMITARLQVGTAVPVAIAIAALLIAVGPTVYSRLIEPAWNFAGETLGPLWQRFGLPRFSPATRTAVLGGTATVVVASVVYGVWTSGTPMPNVGLGSMSMFSGAPIEGRGVALAGDLLRIGDKTLRLSGIEAPERDQTCRRGGTEKQPGRSWRCGQAAIEALSQTVRGRPLSCTASGTDSSGVTLARCIVGIEDVAAMMVRGGHVFSDGGLLARYGAYEKEARAKRVGLWQGEAERPSDYRSKRWDEAKRKAPSGCPIKGQVSAQGREYFTPWTAGYERVRVKEARGERWFCSETEAQAAGFKAAERS